MEKDKQFEIQRLKENRKTVLGNLTKQINIISPLLADFESENLCTFTERIKAL